MKTLVYYAIGAILLSGYAAAAPLNKAHISGDALWLVHLDLNAFKSSQFGRLALGEITQRQQQKIDALTQLLGTDLTRDIDAVTLYGPDATQENAVALLYGRFDRNKLLTLLKLNDAYAESTYKNHLLYHWKDDKKQTAQVGAFWTDNCIVISQTESAVGTALDVLAGQAGSLAANPHSVLYELTNAPAGTILLTAAQSLTELTRNNPHAAILQNSSIMAVVAGESSGIMKLQIRLDAASAEAAGQIETIVRGIMAFGLLQQDKNPKLAPLMNAVTLTRQDNRLELVFQYSSAELFEMAKADISHIELPAAL
ncbi:MAG: hypothetical protein KBI46_10235 [Phycisphaerae bacterium]|nr:hypothetical protein [Phycisphaerae bacterium]